MDLPPPPPPPLQPTNRPTSSSSFHSAAQSFSPESPLSETPTPVPSFSQLGHTHLPDSPFADPPILPSPFPSVRHSVERFPGVTNFSTISLDNDVSVETSSNYSLEYSGDHSRRACGCSDLDPLCLSARIRSCDVYIGVSGQRSSMICFVKWLRAELEMQGMSCFVADRSRCKNACAHGVARAAMDVAAFGVVVVTRKSFSSPYCIEEIRIFLEKKKLFPIFFGLSQGECIVRDIIERRGEVWEQYGGELWESFGGLESEWREAVNGLSRLDLKLEANASNLRDCILEAVVLLGSGLGRRRVVERVKSWKELAVEEFPFSRNANFVGRNKELVELELLLFGDVEGEGEDGYIKSRTRGRHRRDEVAMGESVAKQSEERRRMGKEPMVWKESAKEIEMQGHHVKTEKNAAIHKRADSTMDILYGKGIACISGDSGIGKTELLLEFAHLFFQRYKMILWVGGESRYIRQNYMKLLPLLGVDVSIKNKLCSKRNWPRSFEDIEEEAIRKVRKELMRDIPYLLVIDNLESEKDWWDGRNIMELLPRFGGATHVMISTRLPQILNIKPLRLLYLSGAEAMIVMKGSLRNLETEEADALRLIEEKLGRLPLGFALIAAILSELPTNPPKLFDTINRMPYRELTWSAGEDLALKRNPFLIQLLDFCFSICDSEPKKLATRMVQASGLFAPLSVPISMLALAASEPFEEHHGPQLWRKCQHMASCMCMPTSSAQSSEVEVLAMLVKFRIARISTKTGYFSFHDIMKLYARKRGNGRVADSVVRALSIEGSLPQHTDHIWAACFLLFKFGNDPVAVNLSIHDLLSFIDRFVLPLAMHSFNAFFRCNVVLELLRLATETLEALEDSFLTEAKNSQNTSSCLRSSGSRSILQSDPHLYQKFAHLRATLLETRAKLMLRGGLYDTGERLCRTAVSIKEVIYGWEHPQTVSSRETLERLIRFQSNF